MKPPGDGHGQLRFMFHIGRRSEKVESAFVAAPPGEQHDARALGEEEPKSEVVGLIVRNPGELWALASHDQKNGAL